MLISNLNVDTVESLEGEGIHGGELASAGEFPYQVSLEIFGTSICGGGIIDDYHVITAAHCFAEPDGKFYNFSTRVVAGTNTAGSWFSSKISSDVEKVYIPKIYTEIKPHTHLEGDIAVLKLKQPLKISSQKKLGKLELPEKGKSYANETAMITGFGWNWVKVNKDPLTGKSEESGGTNGKLRFAKTKVLSHDTCQSGFHDNVTDMHICARVLHQQASDPQGVCSGDSGGPLVHKHKTLIGIVSTSPLGCSEAEAPGVYTRVSAFLDFVDKAVKNKNDSTMIVRTLPSRSWFEF
ncbi:hypothetical protein QAD02_010288 [Eretmocerus hayati]|uniref:Uncharacterized protein n=1 Tax=Eretmocerus hayati TaxID=131215 RepID=A0ACC2NG96_9HYME|nr:hypothetical protein QAD02_010288 [Eretmocerus hayati]